MNRLENEIFNSNKHVHNIRHVLQYRYVDDVLCLWSSTLPQLNDFLALINSFYPSIQFTLEIGEKKSIS